MKLHFSGELFEWRGPAPHVFIALPEDESDAVAAVAAEVSYGWGVVPVAVTIGETSFTTSLIPKDGRFLLPVKAKVRVAEQLELGMRVDVRIEVGR